MAAVSTGDEQAVDEFLVPDFLDHNPVPGQAAGSAGFKQWMRTARTSFPDLQATVGDVVVEGDRVAGRVTYRGTHRGTLAGVPGTGRTVEFEAFHFMRFRDGRIAEWWGTADLLGALLQSGARVVRSEDGT
jgi:steroid delta-isomerase-like uncharacterized protein